MNSRLGKLRKTFYLIFNAQFPLNQLASRVKPKPTNCSLSSVARRFANSHADTPRILCFVTPNAFVSDCKNMVILCIVASRSRCIHSLSFYISYSFTKILPLLRLSRKYVSDFMFHA